MNKFAAISALVATAMATTAPDYFCTVKVTKYADKAKCDADKDGAADEAAATAFTKAVQAAKTTQVEEGDYAYKVTACTKNDGVKVEYAKKADKGTALADDDEKAAVKAVKAVTPVTFGECTAAGLKYAFVSEADAKYAAFNGSNTCRVDKIHIFSDKDCKTEIKEAAKVKTALTAAQDFYDKSLLYKHQKSACTGTDDKVAECKDGKITVTEYENAAAAVAEDK